jgi:hypothetical protein
LPGPGDKRSAELSPNKKRVVHAKGPHVIKLRDALEKYVVEQGILSKELVAAFKKDIQEGRAQKRLAKTA